MKFFLATAMLAASASGSQYSKLGDFACAGHIGGSSVVGQINNVVDMNACETGCDQNSDCKSIAIGTHGGSQYCFFYSSTSVGTDPSLSSSFSCYTKEPADHYFADDECATCEWTDDMKMKIQYMGPESRSDSRVQDSDPNTVYSNSQVDISSLHLNFDCYRNANDGTCTCMCNGHGGRVATICHNEWVATKIGYYDSDQMVGPEIVENYNECKSLCIATYGDNCGYFQYGLQGVPGLGIGDITDTTATDTDGHQCWIGDTAASPSQHPDATNNAVYSIEKPDCPSHSF